MYKRGERVKFWIFNLEHIATVISDNGQVVEVLVDWFRGKKYREVTIQKTMLYK